MPADEVMSVKTTGDLRTGDGDSAIRLVQIMLLTKKGRIGIPPDSGAQIA